MAIAAKHIAPPDRVAIRRALLSVSDKTGLVPLARALSERGIELVSTGGTAAILAAEGIAVRDVSDLTGFPEVLDGRVKTLHPGVHGGLLAIRDDAAHGKALADNDLATIDLLVVNLYPFEQVLAAGADEATQVENIDIGGPAMIRAAAKNHAYVTVVTDPADYDALLEAVDADGSVGLELRRQLAAKAFARTAAYDSAVSGWFAERLGTALPEWRSFGGRLQARMRYGENPHQEAGFYASGDTRPGAATAKVLQGKQLSYNNINDTDAAYELVAEFDPGERPAIVIVKHANPCGVAIGGTLEVAYKRALACDPVSAFGGIIAANCEIDAAAATAMTGIFTEVIIAPSIRDEAAEIFAARKNLRVLVTGALPDPAARGLHVRSVAGGLLVQTRDNGGVTADSLRVVTRRQPSPAELNDLLFAFRVAKHVKSNAIVYARNGATVGVGAGQMSRVDSARIAARKAEDAAAAAGETSPATLGSVVARMRSFPSPTGCFPPWRRARGPSFSRGVRYVTRR